MIDSYISALVVIIGVMSSVIGRIHTGLVSMVPNLVSTVIAPGSIDTLSIPSYLLTIMVGSIALGLMVLPHRFEKKEP